MKRISDIAHIQSGIYCKPVPKGDVYYLQVKDFNANGEMANNLVPTVKNDRNLHKHFLQKGDLLFAAKGTSNFCVIYNGDFEYAIASSSLFAIKLTTDLVDPEFLCWYLNSSDVLERLKASAVGTSTPSITKSVIAAVELKIPPLEKQKLIISISNLQKKEKELYLSIIEKKRRLIEQQLINETI
ncbi:restriction endonuclease subunit S [Bacteroides sp.]